MKAMVEVYVGFWLLMLFMVLAMSFTSINLHVNQARRLYNDVKAELQASNGAICTEARKQSDGTYLWSFADNQCNISDDGFAVAYTVEQQYTTDEDIIDSDETWIYNNVYKLTVVYVYTVPFFGYQVYPMTGFVY